MQLRSLPPSACCTPFICFSHFTSLLKHLQLVVFCSYLFMLGLKTTGLLLLFHFLKSVFALVYQRKSNVRLTFQSLAILAEVIIPFIFLFFLDFKYLKIFISLKKSLWVFRFFGLLVHWYLLFKCFGLLYKHWGFFRGCNIK